MSWHKLGRRECGLWLWELGEGGVSQNSTEEQNQKETVIRVSVLGKNTEDQSRVMRCDLRSKRCCSTRLKPRWRSRWASSQALPVRHEVKLGASSIDGRQCCPRWPARHVWSVIRHEDMNRHPHHLTLPSRTTRGSSKYYITKLYILHLITFTPGSI